MSSQCSICSKESSDFYSGKVYHAINEILNSNYTSSGREDTHKLVDTNLGQYLVCVDCIKNQAEKELEFSSKFGPAIKYSGIILTLSLGYFFYTRFHSWNLSDLGNLFLVLLAMFIPIAITFIGFGLCSTKSVEDVNKDAIAQKFMKDLAMNASNKFHKGNFYASNLYFAEFGQITNSRHSGKWIYKTARMEPIPMGGVSIKHDTNTKDFS